MAAGAFQLCGEPETSYLFQPQTERRHWNDALSSIDVHEGQANRHLCSIRFLSRQDAFGSLEAFYQYIKQFLELGEELAPHPGRVRK